MSKLQIGKKLYELDIEEVPVADWRRKKVINPDTGRLVYKDSKTAKDLNKVEKLRLKRSCKEGYKYDFKKKKCVKKSKEELSREVVYKQRKECEQGQVRNPITGRCVSIESKAGKTALKLNYEKNFLDVDKNNFLFRF